jgi:serine-type D-Ala-D-Ala endopeptidase (penicillin-binding protein 7)
VTFRASLNSGANVVRVFPLSSNSSYQSAYRWWAVVLGLAVSSLFAQPAEASLSSRPSVAVKVKKVRAVRVRYVEPARPSYGQLNGLHANGDALELKSGAVLVLDQDTNEVLFAKNTQAVLPIASITKLMTALVVTDAKQPMDQVLTIDNEDIDTEKNSRSRLRVGTALTREEMLRLALMASENRAANALGRNYPGGLPAIVAAMNRKAQALGMSHTHYVEPTGLSSLNQSNAADLALLVREANNHEVIRSMSTTPEMAVAVGSRALQFRNTNSLVRKADWEIGVQKTGYITEAGRCLVMQAQMAGRKLIFVLLDSAGKYSRVGDAERIRKWLTDTAPAALTSPAALTVPAAAPALHS